MPQEFFFLRKQIYLLVIFIQFMNFIFFYLVLLGFSSFSILKNIYISIFLFDIIKGFSI